MTENALLERPKTRLQKSAKEVAENARDNYYKYIKELAEKDLSEVAPRSARNLLNGASRAKNNKGEMDDITRSFVKDYNKELLERENAGREAVKSHR